MGTEPCCPASASCPGWLQALGAPHMSAPHFLSGRALQSENPVHWPGALTWDSAVLWPCRNFSRVSHLFIQSYFSTEFWGCFPRWCSVKESTCQCRRPGFHPWVGKIPWRRKWQPIPVFLPGKSHGQRSLAGYSPWGHKETDRTERLTLSHVH